MSRCDRFEREGLELLERGLELGEHFSTCETCRAEREVYERLREAVAEAGEDLRPPEDWREGVRERISARSPGPSRRARWAVFGGLAAAAALLFVISIPREPSSPSLELTVEAEGETVLRGEEAQPGDRIVVAAQLGPGRFAELRVYRNDVDLLIRCSEKPPCRRVEDRLELELRLDAIGSYQTLLVISDSPIPGPTARGLDADIGEVRTAGGSVLMAEEIEVR